MKNTNLAPYILEDIAQSADNFSDELLVSVEEIFDSQYEMCILPQRPPWVEQDNFRLYVNEVAFCEEFKEKNGLLYVDGTFYDINGGKISEKEIENEIYVMLAEYFCECIPSKVKRLINALKFACHAERPEICEDEIHTLNGVLKTDGTFVPELEFSMNRLNVEYLKTAANPVKFLSFLSDLLEADDIITLQEYLGYLLIPSTRAQVMLSIIGDGDEGKSIIGIVLKEIFGDSMKEGDFRRLETDKFFRANLKDKLVFVDDDLQMKPLRSTGTIKSLITLRTPTDIEFKNKQSFSERLYARFLCFGNGTIKALNDMSGGFRRRMIILKAKPVPKDRKTNRFIVDEIIAEKTEVFLWMFEGLRRLIANEFHLSVSEAAKGNAAEMTTDNCNIIEFLDDADAVLFDSEAKIPSLDLFNGYNNWCAENALTAIKKEAFINWLKSNQAKYEITYDFNIISNGKRVRGFKGLKIQKEV